MCGVNDVRRQGKLGKFGGNRREIKETKGDGERGARARHQKDGRKQL